MNYKHIPVLLDEVIDFLDCKKEKIYVDATVGLGGHSENILKKIESSCLLLCIDQDKEALERAEKRLAATGGSFKLIHDNFVNLKEILKREKIHGVDGIVFDLGVSSFQIDNEKRGFSFSVDGPLDMRMNRENPLTASILVNSSEREELIKILREYGEERWTKRIVDSVIHRRKQTEISTTDQLVKIILSSVPPFAKNKQNKEKILMRTFQALRIAVNDEINVLKRVIKESVDCLNPKGRICFITFHSLEDRVVKEEFKRLARACDCPPDFPICTCQKEKSIKILTPKPLIPSEEEVVGNKRARSAKLRVAEKI